MKTGVEPSAARTGVSPRAYFPRGVIGIVLCAAILFTVAFWGCARENRPSIVLIVVDTLRADRTRREYDGKALMPHVQALARQALVYENATAAAPMTMPSVAALLTGLYPDRAGVVTHSRAVALDVASPTLAEIARAGGYSTRAVVANPWLASPATRFSRGFESYTTKRDLDIRQARLDATAVTDLAINALETAEPPTLLWAHYIDMHMPYQPPAADAAALGNASGSSTIVRDYVSEAVDRQTIYFVAPYSPQEIGATRALYDAAARAVDREIGRLLDAIDRTLGRNVIVIVTADHGESLGEHGLYFAHDFTLYGELTHVPLLVRIPGSEAVRIQTRVSLVDVLPTVCEHAGLRCPDALDGTSLSTSDTPRDAPVYSVGPPYRERYDKSPYVRVHGLEGRWCALRSYDRSLLRIPTERGIRWEAYDLAADPGETRNVFEPERDANSVRKLNDWASSLADAAREAGPRSPRSWRRDELKDLRALGYLD